MTSLTYCELCHCHHFLQLEDIIVEHLETAISAYKKKFLYMVATDKCVAE